MAKTVATGSEDEPEKNPVIPKEPDLIDDLMKHRAETPDLRILGEAVYREFGGPRGLAKEIKSEYDAAPPKSTTRTYLLRTAVDLLQAAAKLGGGPDPLDQVDPEQLKAAIRKIAKESGQ